MPESGHPTPKQEQTPPELSRDMPPPVPDTDGEPPSAASAALFATQIKKDAQQQITKIREKADLSAASRIHNAERQADGIERQIKQEAAQEAKRIQATTMSGVSMEAKRTMLRTRGEVTQQVLQAATAKLKTLRGTKDYADFLTRLAVQGILALGDDTCVLAPAAQDSDLLTQEVLSRIQALAETASGRQVKAAPSRDLPPAGSGVRVYSSSGNMLFDNTLTSRLARLRDELAMIVAEEVFGGEDDTDAAR